MRINPFYSNEDSISTEVAKLGQLDPDSIEFKLLRKKMKQEMLSELIENKDIQQVLRMLADT